VIKQTVKYTDFNGQEQSQDFYFHLSRPELVRLEVSMEGGFQAYVQQIAQAEKMKELLEVFDKLLEMSYGKKSDDGQRFEKTPEMLAEFKSSPAYEKLWFDLATNAELGAAFINGVMPQGLDKDVNQLQLRAQEAATAAAVGAGGNPGGSFATSPAMATGEEPRVLSQADLRSMSHSEVSHLIATGQAVIGPTEG